MIFNNRYLELDSPSAMYPRRASGRYSSGGMAWFYQNLLQGLIGIIPDFDGLKIKTDNLQKIWNSATATRQWRGNIYKIHFERKQPTGIWIDGQRFADELL